MDSHIGPKVGLCAKFPLDWLIGGHARECDITGWPWTPPCENRANSGPASLVPVPELSNYTKLFSLLFADDTTFQLSNSNLKDLFETANIELEKALAWFQSNLLTL